MFDINTFDEYEMFEDCFGEQLLKIDVSLDSYARLLVTILF